MALHRHRPWADYAGPVPLLVILSGALAAALAVWAVVRLLRGEPAIFRQVIAAGVVEAGMLLVAIAAIFQQARGMLQGDPFVFWGYLITALFVLPICVAWAFADRSKVSSAVMAVGGITIAVMMWRAWQVAGL